MSNTSTLVKEIKKGDVVSYKGGWRRVTRVTKKTVNLDSVRYSSGTILKGVPIEEVKEDLDGYYAWFSTTETYQSS